MSYSTHISEMRQFFLNGATNDICYRIKQLKKLQQALQVFETEILQALHKDLRKSEFEAYATEIFVVKEEIKQVLRNIARWSRPERVSSSLFNFPSKSYIYKEPYGVVLVISPWNYPFGLAFTPVVGAIAAGNCIVLKPSEYSSSVSKVIQKVVEYCFDPQYIHVIQGDADASTELLREKFDYIFFTGSTHIGKKVMEAAAKHLTPVTLELGGKSPCIVDKDTDLSMTAKRIIWGKLLNAGQTCIAPDYVFIHFSQKDTFLSCLKETIKSFYGENPMHHQDYCKIIHPNHFQRLVSYLSQGTIAYGGQYDITELTIEPTILTNVDVSSPVMQEEIFGPILPILEYDKFEEVIQFIKSRPKPLAMYVFSRDVSLQKSILSRLSFGGGCINDTLLHVTESQLPFGGIGDSGTGAYHGKNSFDTFTHRKSIVKRSFRPDIPLRYPPYNNKLQWVKQLFR